MNIRHGDTASYLAALHGRAEYQVSAIYPHNGQKKLVLVGTFNDAEAATLAAEPHDGKAQGLYASINRLSKWATNPAKLANRDHAANKDYSARKHAYLDFDSQRPDPEHTNATEGELNAALHTRDECVSWLADMGWPDPKVIGESGNGGTLLYRLADNVSDDLYRRAHGAIADRFNTDKAVTDRRRITPLFGTLKTKGEHTSQRPQRAASCEVNTDALPVTAAMLTEIAALYQPEKKEYVNATLIDYDGKQLPVGVVEFLMHPPAEGERNTKLFRAALAMRNAGFTVDEAIDLLQAAGLALGLDQREVVATIASPFKHARTQAEDKRQEVTAWIDGIKRRTWSGRSGATDYKAALAVGSMAYKVGRIEVNAAVRDVAVLAGVSREATGKALRRLWKERRVLRCTNLYSRDTGQARRYKLVGEIGIKRTCVAERASGGRAVLALHVRFIPIAHDAFNSRGGGGCLAQIIAALIEFEALNITRLASLTGRDPATVSKALKAFQAAGGVTVSKRLWRLAVTTEAELLAALDRLALACNVTGRNDKRRAVYETERHEFHEVHHGDIAMVDHLRAERLRIGAEKRKAATEKGRLAKLPGTHGAMIARALQDRGVYLTTDGKQLNIELTAKCDRKDAQIAEMITKLADEPLKAQALAYLTARSKREAGEYRVAQFKREAMLTKAIRRGDKRKILDLN